MALSLAPNSLATLVAGSALVVLGLGLLAARYRNRAVLSFSVFCVGFGAFIAALPLEPTPDDPGRLAWDAITVVARFVYVGGLFGVFLHVPTRLQRTERAAIVAFACGALAWTLFATARGALDPAFRVLGAPTILEGAGRFAGRLTSATVIGALLGLAFRFATVPDRLARRSLSLLTIGLVLFTTGNAGALLGTPTPGATASVVALIGVALAWLTRTGGRDGTLARNVAIAIPALLLANMILTLFLPGFATPAGRLAAVAFLAYAVLRGLITGLDSKVHFAISKGTVAAIFVVVFFVASELAQLIFDARYNSFVGIAAAGMLVFALAPLQRAAERLAERAVPLAPRPAAAGAADVYKSAVRAAMRDGSLSRREERHLAEVARGLGLDPVEAHELRDQVEAERT